MDGSRMLDREKHQVEDLVADSLGHAVDDVSLLAAGAWSRAFSFRAGSQDFVVRLSALDEDFHKDRLAARHASAALPIPRVLEVGTTESGFFAISERAFGDDLENADEAQMRARLPALMAALDAMRTADIADTSGYGVWRADGNAHHATWREALLSAAIDGPGRRNHGWRERLASSPTGTGAFDAAFEELRRLAEVIPQSRHLIHADLLNRNVLAEGDRITGVFDWGSSMYGDFLFDLAWISFWAPWYPAWAVIDFREAAARHYAAIGLEVPAFEERLRACEIYIALDGQAYQAHRGRWSDLEWTAARTYEVARGGRR
jgi:hygromycin-B 4-O-kinase